MMKVYCWDLQPARIPFFLSPKVCYLLTVDRKERSIIIALVVDQEENLDYLFL